eukprot:gene10152-18819_t
MPELTPNVMMLGSNNVLLQEDIEAFKDGDLRKRAKYLERCKENIWKGWSNENVKALREKHNLVHHGKENQISLGDVVLINGEAKNRGGWAIGRGQCKYPLELACDEEHKKTEARVNDKENAQLNAQAKEFRPKRKAATIAVETIRETFRDEERELADD